VRKNLFPQKIDESKACINYRDLRNAINEHLASVASLMAQKLKHSFYDLSTFIKNSSSNSIF